MLPFGNAKFYGDLHTVALNGAVTGSVATPTGQGYYLVARDGGVFTFGDARFHGSMGGMHLNQPIVGLLPDAGTGGYWLVASDGGVFTFDAAVPRLDGRSAPEPAGRRDDALPERVTCSWRTTGGIFKFSSLPFFGSLARKPGPIPITSACTTG